VCPWVSMWLRQARFALVTLLAALSCAACSRSESSSTTSSAPTGNTGAGGGAVCGSDNCCPESRPAQAAACTGQQLCSYDAQLCLDAPSTARCADDYWHVMTPVACSPLAAGAPCDPLGTWRLVPAGDWAPAGSELVAYTEAEYELEVTSAPNGAMAVEGNWGSMDLDGCTWSTGWTLWYRSSELGGQVSAEWADLEIAVALSGDAGTAMLHVSCRGECTLGELEGTAAVERQGP
jgi:hypothetical protein